MNSVDASCLFDTGAAVSLIFHGIWRKLQSKDTLLALSKTAHELEGVPLNLFGKCCIEAAFESLNRMILTPFLVAEMITFAVHFEEQTRSATLLILEIINPSGNQFALQT